MTKLVVKLRSWVRASTCIPQPQDVDHDEICRSKHAAEMRNYRSNMKSKPEKYKLFRRLECDRLQYYRRNMTTDQRKRQNELSKLRMQKYRAKQKAAVSHEQRLPNTPNTRSAEVRRDKQREQWKLQKRQHRASLSIQKKRRIREKDAAYKHELSVRKNAANTAPTPNEIVTQESDGFTSDVARRKAISRARNVLPKESAEKFAQVVAGVIHTSNEKKKDAMKKKGITADDSTNILQSVRETCSSLKGRRKRFFVSQMSGFLDRQHGLKTKASRHLNIGWKYLMKYSKMKRNNVNVEDRKTRADAMNRDVVDSVQEFYQHPNVATEMPNRKGLGKNADKPKFVLQKTLQQTYNQFCEEHPTSSIRQSKFAQLRPHNVLVQGKAKLYQCLCEYCTNISLKIKAVNKVVSEMKLDCTLVDCYQVSALTLCPQDDGSKLANLSCIDRECDKCGIKLLDSYLKPLLDIAGDSQLWWQRWGKTPVISAKAGKTRVTLLRVSSSLVDLLEELKEELQTFSSHLFLARWQQSSFYAISRNPPEGSVVLVMDFAENYSCVMQHEVQSAHWYIAQITLHPMVAYYMCNGDCGNLSPVREAIHIISEDMQHDAHAVQHFVTLATKHLTGTRGLKPLRLIKFSDGCGAQYKSKIPFADLSQSSSDLGIPCVEHHFFGSRHGKNPCDGEGGILKNAAARAVKGGATIINSAESLFQFCLQKLSRSVTNEDGGCNHSRRVFFLVHKGDIERDRPDRTGVSTVPGTRQVHAAVGVKPHLIKKRRLSCFCHGCDTGGNCDNAKYISSWTEAVLKVKQRQDDVSGVQASARVDYSESEVVQTHHDVYQSEVLKDLFSDVLIPDISDKELTEQCRTETPSTDQQPDMAGKGSPHQRGIEIHHEQYYAVYYDNEYYIGRMLSEEEGEYLFKFLHRVRTTNQTSKMYDWPARSDHEKVLGKFVIDGPLTLVGSGPFSVKGLDNVERLYADMKMKTQVEL